MIDLLSYLIDWIPFVSDILILSIVVVALIFLEDENKLAVLTLGLAVLMFDNIDSLIPDSWGAIYYIGAAIVDLIIIALLNQFSTPTKLILQIQNICLLFICLNLFGWICFMLYFQPEAYNFLCAVLYAWTLVTIFRGRDKHVLGNNTVGRGGVGFLSNNHTSGHALQANKKATRN